MMVTEVVVNAKTNEITKTNMPDVATQQETCMPNLECRVTAAEAVLMNVLELIMI